MPLLFSKIVLLLIILLSVCMILFQESVFGTFSKCLTCKIANLFIYNLQQKQHSDNYNDYILLIFTTAMKGLFTLRATGCTVSATQKGQELKCGEERERFIYLNINYFSQDTIITINNNYSLIELFKVHKLYHQIQTSVSHEK